MFFSFFFKTDGTQGRVPHRIWANQKAAPRRVPVFASGFHALFCSGHSENSTKGTEIKVHHLQSLFQTLVGAKCGHVFPYFFFFTQKLTLRYEEQIPNFFEVFIENPDKDFSLELLNSSSPNQGPVWSCEFRKGQCLIQNYLKYGRQHFIVTEI